MNEGGNEKEGKEENERWREGTISALNPDQLKTVINENGLELFNMKNLIFHWNKTGFHVSC